MKLKSGSSIKYMNIRADIDCDRIRFWGNGCNSNYYQEMSIGWSRSPELANGSCIEQGLSTTDFELYFIF